MKRLFLVSLFLYQYVQWPILPTVRFGSVWIHNGQTGEGLVVSRTPPVGTIFVLATKLEICIIPPGIGYMVLLIDLIAP
jgi:hypothetical protein